MGRDVIEIMFTCADSQQIWVMIDADAAYPYARCAVPSTMGANAMDTRADAWTSAYADQPEFADAWASCYGTAVRSEFTDIWANGYGTAVPSEFFDAWAQFERGDAR